MTRKCTFPRDFFFFFYFWVPPLSPPFFLALVCVCAACVETDNNGGTDMFTYFFICTVLIFKRACLCSSSWGKRNCVCVSVISIPPLSLSLSFSITGIFFSWWCNIGPLCPHILSHVRFERGWNFEEEKTTTLAPIVIFVFVCFFIRVGCVCVMFGALRNLENLFFCFIFIF